MTIKQQGGVFGRNPTFNDVEVTTLTADGNVFAEALGVNTTSLTAVSGFGFASLNGSNGGGIVLQQNGTPKVSIASFGNDQYIDAVGKTVIRTGATVTGAPVNVMEFQADRNVKMSAGNLIFINGTGIDFSATAGTGTSELFDDYEEGEWRPSITDLTNTATPTANNFGYYTKIGRTVTLSAYIQTSALNGVAGNIRIGNLPFTVANSVRARAGAGAGAGSGLNITAGHNVSIYALPNTTNLILMVWNDVAGSTQMTATEWSDDGGIMIGLTYVAA